MKIVIQAELPEELFRQARAYVQEGWAAGFNELLADALRRYLNRILYSLLMRLFVTI
jgi:hypothetical protein